MASLAQTEMCMGFIEGTPESPKQGILVTDFDSTVTRKDFYDLVRKRWPVPADEDPWEKYIAGELTHFEALREIFGKIRTSEAELLELADSMEVFPDFAPVVKTLHRHGWEVVVASAGCRWYIDHLLAQAGVDITVFSNPGTFDPDHGLQMEPPAPGEFFSQEAGVNKLAIVRDALRRSNRVAFAGDGRPDLDPALLIPAEWRFARGWLAGALDARGEKYHPLPDWTAIAETLLC